MYRMNNVAHDFFVFSFQNRELQIMRRLEHCNIVKLKYFFYSSGDKVIFTYFTNYFIQIFVQHAKTVHFCFYTRFKIININSGLKIETNCPGSISSAGFFLIRQSIDFDTYFFVRSLVLEIINRIEKN